MTTKNNSVLPLYLDYMATTPVDPRVAAEMMRYLGPEGIFGNPASVTHIYGKMAAEAVDKARQQIAESLNTSARSLIFTSGATEANNLAILGAARFYQRKGRHLVTMATEHKAVLDSFARLESEGFEVTYLTPESSGLLNHTVFMEALRPDTILVSLMHVNNETGVIQDIGGIGELLKGKGIVFHVDAAQSAGKLPIDLSVLQVDLMSLSAHKNYGPKGVGALYVRQRPRIRLQPQSFGGSHEGGLRSGTLATHQIAGMGLAFALSEDVRECEQARLFKLREKLWAGIRHLPGIQLNGDWHWRVAGNLNVSFTGLQPDDVLTALSELAVSTTSACLSATRQPSYVLKAMGLSQERALCAVRLSLGRFTTEKDVDRVIEIICAQISHLHTNLYLK